MQGSFYPGYAPPVREGGDARQHFTFEQFQRGAAPVEMKTSLRTPARWTASGVRRADNGHAKRPQRREHVCATRIASTSKMPWAIP